MSGLAVSGFLFNQQISSEDIASIRNASNRESVTNIIEKVIDWFCGTHKAEAKQILYDLLDNENTSNLKKMIGFNRLKDIVSPAYRDNFESSYENDLPAFKACLTIDDEHIQFIYKADPVRELSCVAGNIINGDFNRFKYVPGHKGVYPFDQLEHLSKFPKSLQLADGACHGIANCWGIKQHNEGSGNLFLTAMENLPQKVPAGGMEMFMASKLGQYQNLQKGEQDIYEFKAQLSHYFLASEQLKVTNFTIEDLDNFFLIAMSNNDTPFVFRTPDHTMALVKQGDEILFFDPNFGTVTHDAKFATAFLAGIKEHIQKEYTFPVEGKVLLYGLTH